MYDNAAPSAPTALTGTTPTASPPVLTWAASTDTLSGVDHYDVLRGGHEDQLEPDHRADLHGQLAGRLEPDLLRARRGRRRQRERGVEREGHRVRPEPAERAVALGSRRDRRRPALSWTASTDPAGGSGLAGYRVYRDGTLIATTTSITYTDSDSAVVPGTYVYSVVAFDGAGNTTPSAQKTVVVDTTRRRPPAPSARSRRRTRSPC